MYRYRCKKCGLFTHTTGVVCNSDYFEVSVKCSNCGSEISKVVTKDELVYKILSG